MNKKSILFLLCILNMMLVCESVFFNEEHSGDDFDPYLDRPRIKPKRFKARGYRRRRGPLTFFSTSSAKYSKRFDLWRLKCLHFWKHTCENWLCWQNIHNTKKPLRNCSLPLWCDKQQNYGSWRHSHFLNGRSKWILFVRKQRKNKI